MKDSLDEDTIDLALNQCGFIVPWDIDDFLPTVLAVVTMQVTGEKEATKLCDTYGRCVIVRR